MCNNKNSDGFNSRPVLQGFNSKTKTAYSSFRELDRIGLSAKEPYWWCKRTFSPSIGVIQKSGKTEADNRNLSNPTLNGLFWSFSACEWCLVPQFPILLSSYQWKLGTLLNINNYYLLTGCKGRTRKYKPKVFHTARACEGCLENQGLVFPGTARAPS